MRRRASPVQQWVDSIPSPTKTNLPISSEPQQESSKTPNMTSTEPKDIPFPMGTKPPSMTVSAPINVPNNSSSVSTCGLPSSLPYRLARDPSLQSDSSHCSSVESLLELRKADPEAILLGLGFGGCSNSPQESGSLSRIPKRFLQPSKLKGIAINDFVKQQQETSESFDSVSLGYRGLTGSPYVAPSEIVQKIMDRLRENESHETDPYAMYNCYEQYSPIQQNGTLSVLSPDNRQFLERPRSKSPDMRNKRMIIGQKSFAFGHDGDLIEINPSEMKGSLKNIENDCNNTRNFDISQHFQGISTEQNETIEITIPKVDKISPNRLSNYNLKRCDTNIKSTKETFNEKLEKMNENPHSNADHEKEVSTKCWDARRASDGSCEMKFPENLSNTEGRRHSDSFVHSIETTKNVSTVLQKRRTLKRQSRISDTDAINYCNSSTPDLLECKQSDSPLHNTVNTYEHSTIGQQKCQSIDENTQVISKNECCGAKITNTFSEECHDFVGTVNDTLLRERCLQITDNRVEENDLCHREEKGEETCTHEDCTNCSCCTDTKKYWKKMENMVAKNRREMAEIREMLNSVLSVRMEPGF